MIHLFLLALEREEIVAVSYRENAIAQRLAAMPITEDIRELIRHALIWIWKDEEMHSIYIRGAILRFAGRDTLSAAKFFFSVKLEALDTSSHAPTPGAQASRS